MQQRAIELPVPAELPVSSARAELIEVMMLVEAALSVDLSAQAAPSMLVAQPQLPLRFRRQPAGRG